MVAKPELFGLHQNAEILANISEGNGICKVVLALLPRVGASGGKQTEGAMKEKCEEILAKIPSLFR
jgi:dynein heavy chain, axonemal